MPLRWNRNCSSHVLAVACPSTSGAVNSHCFAALRASFAKYALEPRILNVAAVTFPDGSTCTRTTTLIVPRIVFCALRGTSGRTLRTTSPADARGFVVVTAGLGGSVGADAEVAGPALAGAGLDSTAGEFGASAAVLFERE